ncbi:transglycosylase domain-containing protein [Streptomyces capparidis]
MSDEPNKSSGAGPEGGGGAGRPKRTGWRRALPTWRMVLVGTFSFLALCIGAFAVGYMIVDIPPANAAAKKQSTIYLYSDGTEIARTGQVNRENIPLSEVPRHVQRAVLAAEDRDFYSESAVNPLAMGRAAWNTVRGGEKQGGSTITQQYVKNYYLNQKATVSRKTKEFFIAIKLDRETTKDEILEGYLNTSYYGRAAYGIQAASHAYYNKDASELTVAEGAYLAALLNAPSLYDVVTNPEYKDRAEARWDYVLDGMVKEGWLTRAERDRQKFPTPDPVKPPTSLAGQDGYLLEAVKQYLKDEDILDAQQLDAGGYRITTTIDRKKQEAFVEAVEKRLMDKLSDRRKVDRYVRAGGASVEPGTGKVVAMYGGVDYLKQYVNNATRRDYQVGSVFKPIVLASAFDNDATTVGGQPITSNTVYDGDSERPVVDRDGQPVVPLFAPENEDDVNYGPVTVAQAMNRSVNTVYGQMAQDVGTEKVKDTAVALGVPEKEANLQTGPAMSLGTATPSALDMAGVYAAFANHGERIDPWLVAKITKDGKEIDLPEHKEKRVISREAADRTTEVLRGVVSGPGGTGAAAAALGRPAAGKTGTAEEDKAAWFAAYTPQLATVVNVLGQDPDPPYSQEPLYWAAGLPRINGGGFPAEIWTAYMTEALRGEPVKDFDLETGGDRYVPPPVSQVPDPAGGGTGGTTGGGASSPPDTGASGSPPPSGGETPGGGSADGGAADGGAVNGGGGAADGGGSADGGAADGGAVNGGGGAADGGAADGGAADGGAVDGGAADGGAADGGAVDGGAADGGAADGGPGGG